MRAAALAALALSAASCGERAPAPLVVGDVRGTAFLRPAPAEEEPPAEGVPTLGDADRPRPEDLAPVAPPPTAPEAPAPDVSAPSPADADGYVHVSWDELAGFEMSPFASETATAPRHEVPEGIRALSGRKVAAEGFMAPLVYEAGGAKKFLLLKDPMACCFAVTPRINEWIEVTMRGGAVAEYVPHVPVVVYGDLEVREETRDGMSVGLYRLAGTRAEFGDAK